MLHKLMSLCTAIGLSMSISWAGESVLVEPPPLPERIQDGEVIEPDINIIQYEDRIVEEYRHGDKLYAIKVTPVVGRVYYLMDTDGDGSLETTQYELSSGLLIPNWILLEW